MAMIGKKIVDISDFGYKEPVIFKELTLGDAAKITAALAAEKKDFGGDVPEATVNVIVLERLIEQAPFRHDRAGIEDLPLSLGMVLIEQAQSMLDPLVRRMPTPFAQITDGERHPTQEMQNE